MVLGVLIAPVLLGLAWVDAVDALELVSVAVVLGAAAALMVGRFALAAGLILTLTAFWVVSLWDAPIGVV